MVGSVEELENELVVLSALLRRRRASASSVTCSGC